MLFLATVGKTTRAQIRTATRLSEQTIDRAVNRYVEAGIVMRFDDVGGPRPHTLALNARWHAASALKSLLLHIAASAPKYRNVVQGAKIAGTAWKDDDHGIPIWRITALVEKALVVR